MIGFNLTKNPRVTKFKVYLYSCWPNGLYYFDNVKVKEITKEELAVLVVKRSEVD